MSSISSEILTALESDSALAFKKKTGNHFTEGACPSCGKNSVFISKENPWLLCCNHRNQCGYSESTRERYSELFESISEKYPATESDPDAPARAYLALKRGFNEVKVGAWFKGGIRTLYDDHKKRTGEVLTVRFPLWGDHYWERIIDRKDIEKNGGKKAHISYGCSYKNHCWMPPEQTIEKDDWVFITEGIFQAIALLHIDQDELAWSLKACAAISSSNLPRDLIKANLGKCIHWVLAYDNDAAGIAAAKKFKTEIESLGEHVHIALGEPGRDWDDEWRAEKLNQAFLDEALWKGAVALSKTPREVAFWHIAKSRHTPVHRIVFQDAQYSAKLDEKEADNLPSESLDLIWAREAEVKNHIFLVTPHIKVKRISNCYLEFLYIEKDDITQEQFYFFKVRYKSRNPEHLLMLEGSSLENPGSLNRALLTRSFGGSFKGTVSDLSYFHEQWFEKKICVVQSLYFMGYDPTNKCYVFPNFGYHKGRKLTATSGGFLEISDVRLKTAVRTVKLIEGSGTLNWFEDFIKAFDLFGVTALAWWLGSLFTMQIRELHQSWPFFELTGEHEAGKTTLLMFLWRCLGVEGEEGFDPEKGSAAGRARKLAQISNFPFVLIESDRESKDRTSSFNFDEFKTLFNGGKLRITGLGKTGSNTAELSFRGSMCFSQNATVQGSPALLSRIVHCHCTKAHHTPEKRLSVNRLKAISTEKTAAFMDKALRSETKLFTAYCQYFEEYAQKFREKFPNMDNRIVESHAQVEAWARCLSLIFEPPIAEEHYARLNSYLQKRAVNRQERLLDDPQPLRTFWDIYDAYNDRSDEWGHDNRPLFNHSKNPHRIALHLVDFEKTCNELRLPRIDYSLLERQFSQSKKHKYLGKANVKSCILDGGKTRFCHLFERQPGKSQGGV